MYGKAAMSSLTSKKISISFYKDLDEVLCVSQEVDLGQLVAKVIPLGIMKG
jgi:RNA-splicing ligase RtcB